MSNGTPLLLKRLSPPAGLELRGVGVVGSGGAMVLGKLPVLGRPTIWITLGQGPTSLAESASGVVWPFSSVLSLLFLPLFGRRPDID